MNNFLNETTLLPALLLALLANVTEMKAQQENPGQHPEYLSPSAPVATGKAPGMLKDAGLIEKFAGSLKSPIPALGVVKRNLESAVTLGFGKENASAVIKALGKEADVEVKAR